MNSITKIFDDTIKTDHKIITEEAAKSILKHKFSIKLMLVASRLVWIILLM